MKHMGTQEVDDEVLPGPFGTRVQKMKYVCCDEEFADGDEDKNEICTTEWHTTDVADVDYTLDGEYEDNWIITCEEYGCVSESEDEDEGGTA